MTSQATDTSSTGAPSTGTGAAVEGTETVAFSGRCLCGQVQFEGLATPSEAPAMHCHCKDCQRATGSGFATVLPLPDANLKVTGEIRNFRVTGESGGAVDREFCPKCGSPLFTRAALAPGQVFVKAGALDNSAWLRPVVACWTDSRESWCVLTDQIDSVPQNP